MKRVLIGLMALILLVPALIIGADMLRNPGSELRAPAEAPAQAIARGAYLARAGNCMACHTARGGTPYAGGRAIATPFGSIYAGNLTPDPETGLGKWSADDFWRAIHNGKGRDGRFLYPAFPYPDMTRVTRADADALYAYLRSLAPVRQATPAPELGFPFNQRWLLPLWRALYFSPGVYQNDATRDVQWNRGAYLVQGLGHCAACHTARNALGGSTAAELGGGMIPMLGWHAAALNAAPGLGDKEELVRLLASGVNTRSAVFGPMAEVVRGSLQYLTPEDVHAIASYLASLPQQRIAMPAAAPLDTALRESVARGASLYRNACASCHQADGHGVAGVYPQLAGSRSLRDADANNAIRMVLFGGFPPSTRANPRPYGMPPFSHSMDDQEVADVVNYMRQSWAAPAGGVSALQVGRLRSVPVD